jgi:hypothetical protein
MGPFRLGNGRCGYPLTVTDNRSPYLLACRQHERHLRIEVEYGRPRRRNRQPGKWGRAAWG